MKNWKSILIGLSLAGCLGFFSSCKVDEASAPEQNEFMGKSLASHFIGHLDADLKKMGASDNTRAGIVSEAKKGIEQNKLIDSKDTPQVANQVLLSAQLSLANGNTGVTSDSERSKLIDVILGSVSSSLNGKVLSSSAKIAGNSKRLQATSGNSYAVIFKTLAETSISNLDESGLSTKSTLTAIEIVTQCLGKNLKKSGVSSSDYETVLLAVAQGAVASLDDAKIGRSSLDKAVENVVKGLLSGAKSSVTKKADLLDLTDEIAEGAILGLADAGVSFDDSPSYVSTISSAVETELTNQGFTSDQATTASETAQTAAQDGLFILGEGRSGDPGIIATTISGNTSETGDQATFEVRLKSQPSASVSLAVTSTDETEGTVSPDNLTFTVDNWNAQQTVTVTGVDDDVVDGNQSFMIDLGAVTSNDEVYDGSVGDQVAVVNRDDETAGLVVSAISGDTAEDGTQATFTVKLQGKPEADVTVTVESDDETEGTASPTTLIFTSENWNAEQTVTVTGQDDDLYDGSQTFGIVLTSSSEIASYDGLEYDGVLVVNLDGDSVDFVVSEISGDTGEDGTQATFTVKLTSEPLSDVTISVSSSDTEEGTVSPSSLTFTIDNWNAEQTVTVTGVNDNIVDGDQSYNITLSGAGDSLGINPSDVSVTNIDDDTAGINPSMIDRDTMEEGGSATFTVVLTSQPTADVTIPVSSSDEGEGTVSPSSLTFTPDNWNASQTVTVTGVDDALQDGDQTYTIILGAATSNDTNYDSIDPADVSAVNIDDDSPGFYVSWASGDTTEAGGTASFTVRLKSPPTGDVSILLASLDTSEGTVDLPGMTFTTSNWNVPQTATITGVDDFIIDGNQDYTIQITAFQSADSEYVGLDPADVVVTNIDDETAGFVVGAISRNTTEAGGTATFKVKLTSMPSADVTIALSSSDETEGTVSPSSLTFTAANGMTNQTVTVTGVDDVIKDGNQSFSIILAAAVSDDANYDGLKPSDVSVTNTDQDSANLVVSTISGNTIENGGTATFTVRLTSQPSADVSVSVSSSNIFEGTPDQSSLTFTSGNWDTDQTVTVTGVNDGIEDTAKTYQIDLGSVSSSDSNYNGIAGTAVTVINDPFDSTGPSVVSPADGDTMSRTLTVTFDEAVDASTITTNTADSTCLGSIQLSSDNFTTCVQMSADPVVYGASVTLSPVVPFTVATVYQLKVTTTVTDIWGNAMAADFQTLSGLMLSVLPDTGQTTSYTATFGEDADYSINPMSFTDNGDGTVTDNNTRLMWQQTDDNTTRTRPKARTYCTDLSLAGYTDWRLPSRRELMRIVNYGTFSPAIDATAFPGTNSKYYWSSTPDASSTKRAWRVGFDDGYVSSNAKYVSHYVRCVRGDEQAQTSFTDNGDGTVSDDDTDLMWQQEDDNSTRTWENAITYCEGLSLASYSDWRLPNVKELESIVDDTVYSPSIDTTAFPGTNSSVYWSSTTRASNMTYAWYVHFNDGLVYYYPYKTDSYYVRCVRGGL